MSDQLEFHPSGLGEDQLSALTEYADVARLLSAEELRVQTARHLEATAEAHKQNPMINLRLAQALVDSIQKVLASWDSLEGPKQYWLAGAIQYFSKSNDDEPDFGSPIGFEDDAEILNACLKFAGLDQLCVNPEDYDEI